MKRTGELLGRSLSSPRSLAELLGELALEVVRVIRAQSAPLPEPVKISYPVDNYRRDPDESEPPEPERLELAAAIGERLEELRLREGAPAMETVPKSPLSRENRYDAIVARAAARWNVPAGIIKGVIATESSFKTEALREEPRISTRSRGLMQVLETTAKWLGFAESPLKLHDPEVGIMVGTKYLANRFAKWNDWRLALASYNGGNAIFRGPDGRPSTTGTEIRPELLGYVAKVEKHMRRHGSKLPSAVGGFLTVALVLLALRALRP